MCCGIKASAMWANVWKNMSAGSRKWQNGSRLTQVRKLMQAAWLTWRKIYHINYFFYMNMYHNCFFEWFGTRQQDIIWSNYCPIYWRIFMSYLVHRWCDPANYHWYCRGIFTCDQAAPGNLPLHKYVCDKVSLATVANCELVTCKYEMWWY